MFTGIVEEVGRILAIEHHGDHARLHVAAGTVTDDAVVGDSIAVDGCCLTVEKFSADGFTTTLMEETLKATGLGELTVGDRVNLERAMRADTRFGGHLVQGHVDAVGEVVARDEQPGTVYLSIAVPTAVQHYLVTKGSLTVAGVSLTIVDVRDGVARIGLIPHTLASTTLGGAAPGDRLNLEVDVIAKYVERLLGAGVGSPYVGPAATDRAPLSGASTTEEPR